MHLIRYYPYYCLCTFWSYHPYLLLQFIQLLFILVYLFKLIGSSGIGTCTMYVAVACKRYQTTNSHQIIQLHVYGRHSSPPPQVQVLLAWLLNINFLLKIGSKTIIVCSNLALYKYSTFQLCIHSMTHLQNILATIFAKKFHSLKHIE